ncbi:DUF5330 domain-containing protein [Polymorphum gilvum]|uniref:DUF5330 domain-containing protein n=1 Tax=Polymorphum gilvum (strain LMG 25793 / CGMCC 1.9160 / SL003B-26A1) TaxID=991905 RepID=F2IV41_POLGS|nr:DUF5330 domain-containing protein [Polymorphum gilvum]ADZ71372.1 hypothetical protein SL003B_2949 [Polymorphum gilvum SL003B-26A1]
MFFLLRTAFWLTLVLMLIPFGSDETSTAEIKVDPIEAFMAAQATVSDISTFCTRNPQACETGGQALAAIGSRARDGAKIVYEFLDTSLESGSGETQQAAAGDMPLPLAGGTLTPDDMQPAWQAVSEKVSAPETPFGPVPRPNPRSGQRA